MTGFYEGTGGAVEPVSNEFLIVDVIDAGVTNSLYDYVGTFTGQQASVAGDLGLGDGGGGLFYWDSASAATDDGFNVIQPTDWLGGGRWLRLGSIWEQKLVTVGAGGNFATINEAISFLAVQEKDPTLEGDQAVEVRLLTGFVMAEQIICDGVNLGWISLTSVDDEVTIQRSALVETNFATLDRQAAPAFLAINGGRLPVISALFNMDTSGEADNETQHGIMAAWGGSVTVDRYCGVKNATARGLYTINSQAYARYANFSGSYIGCRPGNASDVVIRDADLTNCTLYGLYVSASKCVAIDTDTSGAGTNCVRVMGPGEVHFQGGIANNAGDDAIYMEGGYLYAELATVHDAIGRGLEILGGSVDAKGIDIQNSGTIGVNANYGAKVNISDGAVLNAGGVCIQAFQGASIAASGSTLTRSGGGTVQVNTDTGAQICATGITGVVTAGGQIPNLVTAQGVIWTDDIVISSGSFSLPAATATATITHGLDYTPTRAAITITPNGSVAASVLATTGYKIENITSTQFNFTSPANANPAQSEWDWAARVLPV